MATGTFSIPGVASGMDWGAMVDELISKSQRAYQPMLTKRDNLERKITVYEEFNQAIRALQSKLTTLRLPSIYKAKAVEAARLDSNGLAQSVLTASVTSDAAIMNYDIEVVQIATSMTRYGKNLTTFPGYDARDNPNPGVGMDSVFYINVGGKRGKIDVRRDDTLEDIARKINNARDITSPTVSLDVVASVVDGQLVVRSTKTGAGGNSRLSQEITRANVGHDSINFYPDLNNDLINGSVVINGVSSDGGIPPTYTPKLYQIGLDFDIVGGQVRWRDTDPKTATAGSSYSVGYAPKAADDFYSVSKGGFMRDAAGLVDTGIFNNQDFIDAGIWDETNEVLDLPPGGSIEVKYPNYWRPFEEDVDFSINGANIEWLTDFRPHDGADYTVTYIPPDPDDPVVVHTAERADQPVDTNIFNDPIFSYIWNGSEVVKPPGSTLVVIDENNIIWEEGRDFETVGNGIRWLNVIRPQSNTPYTVKFSTDPGDVLQYNVERSSMGSANPNHDSIFSHHTFMYPDGNVYLPGLLDITWGSNTYTRGLDYVVEGDGIRWIGANRPPDGATYFVQYTPAADEVWRLPAVTRNDTDDPELGSNSKLVSVSPSGVETVTQPADAPLYSHYISGNGTAVITQGLRTWVEGVDFDIVKNKDNDMVTVKWRTEAGYGAPEPGSPYDLKLEYTTTNGANTTRHTYTNTLTRDDEDGLKFDGIPFANLPPKGEFNGKIYADNGLVYDVRTYDDVNDVWNGSYTINGSPEDPNLTVTWIPFSAAPNLREFIQPSGQKYTVEYIANMNVFSFEDHGDGILQRLGFDEENYWDSKNTDAQDALIRINGEPGLRQYSTNNIVFEEKEITYDNQGNVVSLLGLTLNLKGPGTVQLDVSQDAERAVTAVQDYIESYNELMNWINIKMTEKQVDESQRPTLAGDDFRMRWGLLYGDRLLRYSKNRLRELTSQVQVIAFQSRTGREVLYGTLRDAGFQGDGLFTIRLGGAKSTITVDIRTPDGRLIKEEANIGGFVAQVMLSENDDLQTAADKINEALKYNYTSEALGEPYHHTYPIYAADEKTIIGYESQMVYPSQEVVMGTAEVRNGRIVLTSAFNDPLNNGEIPLMVQDSSGVLRYIGLNDRYTILSQVGISTGASTGEIGTNAKSGFLDFEVEKFMETLRTDSDAVADIMVAYMKEMDTFLTNLSSTAQTEFAPGVVGVQGSVSSAIDQLRQQINGINKYLADADRRLEMKADALYRSFSAAENALARLAQQASWLASVQGMLSGNNNSNNY